MDEHLRSYLDVMSHRSQIITLGMPNELGDCPLKVHSDHVAAVRVLLEHPLAVLLLVSTCLDVDLVAFLTVF